MKLHIDLSSAESYRQFLKIRDLPRYRFAGRTAHIPDDMAHFFGAKLQTEQNDYEPAGWLFDYQRDIAATAISRGKYAVFADCGLGKTAILLEFAKHCHDAGHRVLIISPLMVVPQTIEESARFYGDTLQLTQLRSKELGLWLSGDDTTPAITNYEALRNIDPTTANVGCVILDESSILKSHYGKYGRQIIQISRGAKYRLALTGTPAPNDRIEYANHAVFLGQNRTVNEFLARYFINRGQTSERWVLKPHALRPFYRDLSRWSIFLSDPSVYGWRDNCDTIPPIHIHIDHIDMTPEQTRAVQKLTGGLFAADSGGIGQRSKLGQIAKGSFEGKPIPTNKPSAIAKMVESFRPESVIVWCRYNDEQATIERVIPDAVSITGTTPEHKRQEMIRQFKAGEVKCLISKPSILGFGLNLQIATRQVFSGLQDSYEEFYQAVKRSNRYGSMRPLNVHIPVCDVEVPMVQNVLRKADRVDADTREQETLFKDLSRC